MSHFKVVALSTKSSVTDSDTVRTDTVQPTTTNGNITIDVLDDLVDSTLIITNSDAVFNAGLQLNASTAVDTILDDDTMTADSATALVTQQSIKAYVDSGSTATNFDSVQPYTSNSDITIDVLDTGADSTLIVTNSNGGFDAQLQLIHLQSINNIIYYKVLLY